MAVLAMVAAIAGGPTTTPAPADDEAIVRAAMDYIQGWYNGDAARMERSLHPELAKRIVRRGTGAQEQVDQMSALTLIVRTRAGPGKKDSKKRADVKILDKFQGTASVRVDATNWVDYLHLAKINGEWKIVNVLWEIRTEVPPPR